MNFIKSICTKKSAERPLSDVQTGAPRNEIKETRRGTSRC